METFLIAIGSIVPMLLFLVVIHELGHFATARAMGVKVLEFGVGFPPRALTLYTGRTRVLLDPQTRFIGMNGPQDLATGRLVKVASSEDVHGNLVAQTVAAIQPSRMFRGKSQTETTQELDADQQDPGNGQVSESEDDLKHEGKIRESDGGSFILADMLYTINWAPLGGFVRLAGESNPNVPRSLAGKGAGTRMIVLAAGSFMNAVLPLVIFTVLFMVPQQMTLGQVLISEVADGSPAQAAGVIPGDIVLRAKNQIIESVPDLVRVVNLNGGDTMEWVVLRRGREEILLVHPSFGAPEGRWLVGIGIQEQAGRVSVTQVRPGSPARQAGILAGDTVIRAGGNTIQDTADLTGAVGLNQDSEMEWVIERSGIQQVIRVTPAFEQPDPKQWLTGATTRLVNTREETRSQPIWTALPLNLVMTRWRSRTPLTVVSAGRTVDHCRADPPRAACGQPGEKSLGWDSRPSCSLR